MELAASISRQIFMVESMLGGFVVGSSVKKQLIATVTFRLLAAAREAPARWRFP